MSVELAYQPPPEAAYDIARARAQSSHRHKPFNSAIVQLEQGGVPSHTLKAAGFTLMEGLYQDAQGEEIARNIQELTGESLEAEYLSEKEQMLAQCHDRQAQLSEASQHLSKERERLRNIHGVHFDIAFAALTQAYHEMRKPGAGTPDRYPGRTTLNFRGRLEEYINPRLHMFSLVLLGHYGTESGQRHRLPSKEEGITMEEAERAQIEAEIFENWSKDTINHGYILLSSKLPRAVDSAKKYGDALGIPVHESSLFVEREYGDRFQEQPYDLLSVLVGENETLITVWGNVHVLSHPDMESLSSLDERARQAAEWLHQQIQLNGKRVIVVGHRSFERLLLGHLLPLLRQSYADMLETPPRLAPGATITVNTYNDPIRATGRKPIDWNTFTSAEADPIYGTPFETKIRSLLARTVLHPDNVSKTLGGVEYYDLSSGPFSMTARMSGPHFAALPGTTEFQITCYDTLNGSASGKKSPVWSITKETGRLYNVHISRAHRTSLPHIADIPLPPPHNLLVDAPYLHELTDEGVRFTSHLFAFPPEVRKFMEWALSTMDDALSEHSRSIQS